MLYAFIQSVFTQKDLLAAAVSQALCVYCDDTVGTVPLAPLPVT